jgi:hypothetical protein
MEPSINPTTRLALDAYLGAGNMNDDLLCQNPLCRHKFRKQSNLGASFNQCPKCGMAQFST